MIDLHCHILPFVDDGADNARVACAMAEHALRSGVDTIVATPHCNLRGARGNYRGKEYDCSMAMFRALLRQHRIPLQVLPGAEIFLYGRNLEHLLQEKRFPTLNGSRYLLTEFNFDSDGARISRLLSAVAAKGYVPVVAHPERYGAVQEDPQLAEEWFSHGYLLQLNKGSLLNRLGSGAYHTSISLLRAGLADVIASDAHDTAYRPTGFQSLLPLLRNLCPPDYCRTLLEENPERIILDKFVRRPRREHH